MEANELRIGNYINLHNKQKRISENIFRFMLESSLDYALKSYAPIPLTEEWLLKFGFVEINEFNGVGFIQDNFYLWKGNNWDYFYYTVVGREQDGVNEPSIEIKYVHQLQNLYFALKGEELKITKHEPK